MALPVVTLSTWATQRASAMCRALPPPLDLEDLRPPTPVDLSRPRGNWRLISLAASAMLPPRQAGHCRGGRVLCQQPGSGCLWGGGRRGGLGSKWGRPSTLLQVGYLAVCCPRHEMLETDHKDRSLTGHDPSSGGSLLSGLALSSQWLTVPRWLKAAVLHACPPGAEDALSSGCAACRHVPRGTCCKQLMRVADISMRPDADV